MSRSKRFQSRFRSKYVSISDSFLKYLNRSSISCQRALEGELPPPPGLNEIHVRSLEDLQLKFLKLRIDSPDMGPDHVPLPLHWWLLVGMGFIALLMTGNLARRRRLMQTAYPILRQGPRSRSSALLVKKTRTQGASGWDTPFRRPALLSDVFTKSLHYFIRISFSFLFWNVSRLVRPSLAAYNEQFYLLRPNLRIEDIMSMRHATQIVSEAIASGNDQGESIGLRLIHAPRIGGYVEDDEVED